MEETKMYCDICGERIVDHNYNYSINMEKYLRRYLSGDIIKNIRLDICPDCREKISNNDTRNNYLETLGNVFFDILKKLI